MSETCTICGNKRWRDCINTHLNELMDGGLCGWCASWEWLVANGKKLDTVIDGHVYTPGNRTRGEFRGMAGRRFDIEYLADGKRITTFDLWSGGAIPDRWREHFPDTARFLSGAEKAQIGETTCWAGSDYRNPPYPLPNGQLVPEVSA